jgi:hypothetical protein
MHCLSHFPCCVHPLYKQRSATASFHPTAISTRPSSTAGRKKFKRHHQAKARSSHPARHGHDLAVGVSASKPHPAARPRHTFLHRQITAARRRCEGGWSARTRRVSSRRREEHCWCRDEALAVAGERGRGADWPIAGGEEETRSTSRAPRSAKARQRWAD